MKTKEVDITNTTDPGIFKTDSEKNLFKKIAEIKKYYSIKIIFYLNVKNYS